MERSQIWKASVTKAFYGFLAYKLLGGVVGAIVGLVSGAAGVASIINGGGGGALLGPILVGILALAGYVYYFLGIKGMKESAETTLMGDGTAKVYKGALLGLVGTLIAIIPLLGFMLSRAFSGLGLVTLKKAKNTGLLRTFADAAANKRVMIVMSVYIAVISVAMVLIHPLYGCVAFGVALLTFWWYRSMAYEKFGGITGDLAGCFTQVCELVIALGVILV